MRVYGFVAQPSGNNTGPDALLLRALNGTLTETDLSLFFVEVSSDNVEGFMLTRLLRVLVDTWIQSGRKEGEECPWKRQPWREPIQDYIKRNPPELDFTEHGPSLFVGSPPIEHEERKAISLFAKYVEEGLTQPRDKRSLGAKFRKALRSADDPATALYLQMLDSPIAARLFRCDGCEAYYERMRNPKRDTPILRGSWCPNCKGKGKDRARRTEDSRTKRTQEKIEWAADAWAKWTPGNRYGKRSEWVAEKVTKRLRRRREVIKVNWVTRHQTEIEAEVERRNHAKG